MLRSLSCMALSIAFAVSANPAQAQEGYWFNYVRADGSYGAYDIGRFEQAELIASGGAFVSEDIDAATSFGLGIGRRFSSWLRLDLTAERRFDTDVRAADFLRTATLSPAGVLTASTTYEGEYSAIVGLANLYWDLPKWQGITPYVGAGIGASRNELSGFSTVTEATFHDSATGSTISTLTTGAAGENERTRFAWALMAGAAVDLSEALKLDLGYRYLNLGKNFAATTDIISCVCGVVGSPLTATDLDAHEFRAGLRWEFDTP